VLYGGEQDEGFQAVLLQKWQQRLLMPLLPEESVLCVAVPLLDSGYLRSHRYTLSRVVHVHAVEKACQEPLKNIVLASSSLVVCPTSSSPARQLRPLQHL
jgi:hypothetical protein